MKLQSYTFYIFIFFHLIAGTQVRAQLGPIKHLTIEQGLSNNSVRTIFQDHKGFIWLGTYDGLSRYDGYGFKVFRNKLTDTSSIPHNYIYAIAEDAKHQIWVGTGQGIGIYSHLTADFHPAYYKAANGRIGKVYFNVSSLQADASGAVYFGSNGWGLFVQAAGEKYASQISIQLNGKSTNDYNVQQLLIDAQQRVWLFIPDLGLCEYLKDTKKIVPLNNQVHQANCLLKEGRDSLWLGNIKGLYLFDLKRHSFIKSYKNGPQQLNANAVTALRSDGQGRLWVGTEGGGLNILDKKTGRFQYLTTGDRGSGLTSETIYSIHIDAEQRVWLGTIKGGVDLIDPQKKMFTTIAHDPLNKNSLVSNFVSSFFEDDRGQLWLGTEGGGMSVWDRKTNSFTAYSTDQPTPHRLSNNWVSSIKKDFTGDIWVATFGGGIHRFNAQGNNKGYYKCVNNFTSFENDNVWLLYEDTKQRLWASTFGNGKMYQYDRQKDRFTLFDQELNDVITFLEDHQGQLWAGNSHSLFLVDPVNHQHRVFEIGKPIRAIYHDTKERFWLGTEGGGLILFDRSKGEMVHRYSDEDGLCSNAVLNIQEDQAGMLWLSTFNGLSRFDPEKGRFHSFFQSDGLQSNQFLYSSGLKLRDRSLVFGGINGFTIFQPSKIKARNYLPPVYITNVRVDNEELSANPSYVSATKDGWFKTLTIPYNKSVLSLDFAALEFTSPEKINYSTYLEGWDKKWNYASKLRTINYSNLSEGSYTLHIRASSSEGVWNPQEATLTIVVLPPWYRTWLAYLFYAVCIAGLLYLYIQYRSKQQKLEYEVELAKMDAEKEREINEKKLSFFTNISHEFRTPLTLIINPLKDMMEQEVKEVGSPSTELNLVYRNARRLLSLADQLLIFRKVEKESTDLKWSRLQLCELCNEVFLCFVQEAKNKKIQYQFICDTKDLWIVGDREKLEIILYNLLSNALKYTPEGGQIVCSIAVEGEEFVVKVQDTGYGIPSDIGDRLFEKFYQLKNRNHRSQPGFGIGLYLVYQFVMAHKGKIRYESREGQGTTFFLNFQMGEAHVTDMAILEATATSNLLKEIAMTDAGPIKEAPISLEKADLDELVTAQPVLLVVDDNDAIRQYIAKLFTDQYKVLEASSGEQGWKLVQEFQPDLVMSDIMMEGMTGIEMCQKIKGDPQLAPTPVILLTGNSSAEVQLKSVEGGADDYITKPFEKELLIARVQRLLKVRDDLQHYFYNVITLKSNSFKISEEYKDFLEACIRVVEEHLDQDQFTIQMLADELGMSYSKLYKKIKAMSGQSANAFIRYIRLRKAAEMFIHSQHNVNEIAFIVGIKDVKYFRKQFNQTFGMNPSAYIDKYRKAYGKQYHVDAKVKRSQIL